MTPRLSERSLQPVLARRTELPEEVAAESVDACGSLAAAVIIFTALEALVVGHAPSTCPPGHVIFESKAGERGVYGQVLVRSRS